jgi:hypothetical protein
MLMLSAQAKAQHLWWDLRGQKDATCLYGEITVLATNPNIYYCGANWHPGEPAGGYCGIQHNGGRERRTIFSIWDTSPTLHPRVTEADPATIHDRFGGEGEGGHTHMIWPWKEGETFRFFVRKEGGPEPGTIAARYWIFDPGRGGWRHSATIVSPSGGKASVGTIGGGLNSFLENFSGRDKDVPKVALYRLWIGADAEHLSCLTTARGDGTWGRLHDSYFLAEGEISRLAALYESLAPRYGKPVLAEGGKVVGPISDRRLPAEIVRELETLPRAAAVRSDVESPH